MPLPLTPAQRQRQYRERLKQKHPDKYEEMQKRNRERIKSKYVKISLLPKIQQDIRRKKWRNLKKKQTEKDSRNTDKKEPRSRKKYHQKHNKLKRIIDKQNKKIEKMKRRIAALEKKLYRRNLLLKCLKFSDNDNQQNVIEETEPLTPNSKSDSFLKTLKSVSVEDKKKVKRILLEKNILSAALEEQYSNCQSNTERNVMKNLAIRDLISKYKMRTKIGHCLGLKGRIRFSKQKDKSFQFIKKQKANIEEFFLQDNVSRASAGKKETKTLNKVKVQKRYLLDSLVNLHKKFKQETGSTVSYTTFIRHKPFYIINPQLTERNTCACKIHSNIEFKFTALKRLSVLNVYNELADVVKDIVCSIDLRECMFNECCECKNASLKYNFTESKEQETVTWLEWVVRKIDYKKNNEIKSSKRVKKDIKNGNLANLITKFEEELKVYKVHIFNIRHQYNCYKKLKDSLQPNEVVLHCDFSENYTCKMHEEIQSVHFGASQYQITLHTSVVYKENCKPQSYCTFSDSTDHSPVSIWAHLIPVLSDIKQASPGIDVLHVYSDGPCTQYKQKKNFFLFSKITRELGFRATWNFSESYHGKGAADGVGGTIKRLLDKKVSYGSDVVNANSALEMLKSETSIKLFCIDDNNIDDIKKSNDWALNHLTAIPKTMKIHQIQTTSKSGEVCYRILSCFCGNSDIRGFCNCFELKRYSLLMSSKSQIDDDVILSSDEEPILQNKSYPTFNTPVKFPPIRKRKIIISSSDDDDEIYQDVYQIKQPIITALSGSPSPKNKKISKKVKSCLSDDEKIFSTNREDFVSTSKVNIHTNTSRTDNKFTNLAGNNIKPKLDNESGKNKFIRLSPSTHVFKADEGKAASSKICILSNVKVDYRHSSRPKMLSSASRYNISSPNLKTDFRELFTTNLPTKENFTMKQEILSDKNTDGPIVMKRVLAQKPQKEFCFFNTSSDEEN